MNFLFLHSHKEISPAEIAQLVEHNLAPEWVLLPNLGKDKKKQCGNSSVGRAQPCQGWGREFESRFPLKQVARMVESVDTKDLKSFGQ